MTDLLSKLLQGISIQLSDQVLEKQEVFIDELLRWNKRINLTSIKTREEAIEKHLVDSLLLLSHLPSQGTMLDMGSGGGLPGIPIAIARPDLQIVSVDSVGKKINFQKHIRRMLDLKNFQPVHARLEELDGHCFDLVTARALSSFESLAHWAAPLQKEGGQLLVMKGPEGEAELKDYLSTNAGLYAVEESICYRLPISNSVRQIIILSRSAS